MWHSIIKIHIAPQLCMWNMDIIIFTFHICQDIVWCYIPYVLATCYFLHPLCQVPLPACGSLKLSLQPLPLRKLSKQDRMKAFLLSFQYCF